MNNTYQLNFTIDQLNAILTALGEQPYKVASPIIQEIVRQVTEQQNPPAPAEENAKTEVANDE